MMNFNFNFQLTAAQTASSEVAPMITEGSNPIMELNLKQAKTLAKVFPMDTKVFHVSGEPIEVTIECDYKTINVSDAGHRLYIIGICNVVNITGTNHAVLFEGYTNQLNFFGDVPEAQISVHGEPLSHEFKVANGKIISNAGPKPAKLSFPDMTAVGRRRRLAWKPVWTPLLSCSEKTKGQEDDDW